jgi:glycolate oxidase iron-sulfur subunit
VQTSLSDGIDRSIAAQAEAIIRSCVHCGFCLATCPTYRLLGDELDSPRGRIYLIKAALEGNEVTAKTQLHLDRCLTCRACETTCPSGVQYGPLLDIGRDHVERHVGRTIPAAAFRYALRTALTRRALFAALMHLARLAAPFLPEKMRRKVPNRPAAVRWPPPRHARNVLLLDGCVQPVLDPAINAAAARLLDCIGISLMTAKAAKCCGALAHHMNVWNETLAHARCNIDAWWPEIEAGAEAIVSTATGCGPMLRDYGHLLRNDPVYASKAARVADLARDISEVVAHESGALLERLSPQPPDQPRLRVAFHSPCTLQHGLKLDGVVERVLHAIGFELVPVSEGHLCCGSAGTYSLTQPELSERLLEEKVAALERERPDVIATANIGCLMHLRSRASVPVLHWVELVARRLSPPM